jgi:homoprotocatechuate degradation regulator HpaR
MSESSAIIPLQTNLVPINMTPSTAKVALPASSTSLEQAALPRISYRNLPQLFLKAREGLMSHFKPILQHFNLTEQQWRILRELDQHHRLEPRQICQLCQIMSSSMAGVLARMEELELIERVRVSGDQRRVLVSLSAKGDQLIEQIAPLIDVQYRRIEQAYGQQTVDALILALEGFIAAGNNQVERVSLPVTADPGMD